MFLTSVYVARAVGCSGFAARRDSAGGAGERNAPPPARIDGPRRAQRQLEQKLPISTIALMKELHQKISFAVTRHCIKRKAFIPVKRNA